eukprot:755866-Hanusia_phi.AAC.5
MYLDDRVVRLQLWDTAGQERFRSLIPSYIRDSSVAVIVYDVTNRESFDNAGKWIDEVRQERGEDVILALVGNKTDLAEKRRVTREEGEEKAKSFKILFVETRYGPICFRPCLVCGDPFGSAKAGLNVKSLFRQLAQQLPGAENAANKKDSELVEVKLDAPNQQKNPSGASWRQEFSSSRCSVHERGRKYRLPVHIARDIHCCILLHTP